MARTETFTNMGFRLTWPDLFETTKGIIQPMAIGDKGDGTYFMMCTYFAASHEDMAAYARKKEKGEESNEELMKLADAMCVLLIIVGIDGGQGPEDIIRIMNMGDTPKENFTEVGRYKDITYYAITDPASEKEAIKAMKPEYAAEFPALQQALIDALKKAEYFGPRIPGADLVGQTLRFETKDIDGNPVKSEDLFSAHAVTMVNLWATWCGPCKSELEELGNLHRRLEGKNAAVIGICDDGAEKTEDCRKLIAEKNLTYLNILPYEGMPDELTSEGLPTTVFVNSEGKIMTNPIIGVPGDLSLYETTIDSLLAGSSVSDEPVPEDNTGEKSIFRVIVKDDSDKPIEGAAVQFCSDTQCMAVRTDTAGTASYNADPGSYTAHVFKAPEGYEASKEEVTLTPEQNTTVIVLHKAGN